MVVYLFTDLILSGCFKKCPRKSKAEIYGGNPKLKSLSKCLDSGYEQGYHTLKFLGSNITHVCSGAEEKLQTKRKKDSKLDMGSKKYCLGFGSMKSGTWRGIGLALQIHFCLEIKHNGKDGIHQTNNISPLVEEEWD